MKAVILAGGLGTRLSEQTDVRPKPMVEIGGKPILWHILKIYSYHDVDEFIVCCGYKGYVIKEYFSNFFLHQSDVTFDVANGNMQIHNTKSEPWKVTLVDTGDNTQTGGRLKQIKRFLDDEPFCMTYGDGVADVDVSRLIDSHTTSGCLATVTAVRPPGRFGALSIDNSSLVKAFYEKPEGDNSWINGGFFVLNPDTLDYIDSDSTLWEEEPLRKLAAENQLNAYMHNGFWQPMDTLRDRNKLNTLWLSGQAPWKLW